jgi:hypothetical protein
MEYENEEEYNENERKIEGKIREYKERGYEMEMVEKEELVEGDYIVVRYIPYSQRDLYVHKTEMGEYIGMNRIVNMGGEEIIIIKDGLYNDQKSYYSEGYIMLIWRLVYKVK